MQFDCLAHCEPSPVRCEVFSPQISQCFWGERTRPRVLLAAPRRNLAPTAFNTLSEKPTPNPSARRRREHAPAPPERLRRREGAGARVLPKKREILGIRQKQQALRNSSCHQKQNRPARAERLLRSQISTHELAGPTDGCDRISALCRKERYKNSPREQARRFSNWLDCPRSLLPGACQCRSK